MKKEFTRMSLVVTGPTDAPQGFQTLIRHPSVHGAEPPHLVPKRFGIRLTPIAPESSGQLENNVQIVPRTARWGQSAPHALDLAFAVSDGSFRLTPAGRGWQNDIGDLSRGGHKNILHYQE